MKLVWAVAVLAAIALAYGLTQDVKAAASEKRVAAAQAQAALLAAQRDSALAKSDAESARANSEHALALATAGRVAELEGSARAPVVIRQPDSTIRDSLRYAQAHDSASSAKLVSALAALDTLHSAYGRLDSSYAAQEAAAGALRSALASATARGDTLAAALKAVPKACPKFLGLPAPRFGVGAALTTGGIGPAVGVFIPLGC